MLEDLILLVFGCIFCEQQTCSCCSDRSLTLRLCLGRTLEGPWKDVVIRKDLLFTGGWKKRKIKPKKTLWVGVSYLC